MNLITVPAACKALGVSETTIRRAILSKRLPVMRIGNRTLIDLDAAREILITDYTPATITEVSEATGLTVTAIRRGIREGWIPCEKPGRAYQFHLDEVIAAIENRMRDH